MHKQHHHPSNRERLHALLDVLGYLYRVHGKPVRARDYLRLLVSLRPSESRWIRALAYAELESGNPEEAKILLENTLAMNMSRQDRAATFLILSRVLLRMHRKEEAALIAARFIEEKGVINNIILFQ
ncbi:MAG: hypothetical protein A3F67_03205 [Verrucomicrobia bacterium RIFCSPHIGHO2_12_FULL_41_10]|nr:MAG: hypothetical protein A3F67_03205 [Verrucomicrobia bacterium RIFCSPHIGHO2_12_FULL_41_10]HLB33612.1 hypothetical protein [Chthoniobacterales bacterium]